MGRPKKEDSNVTDKIHTAKQLFKEGYNSIEVAAKLGLTQDEAETIKRAYELKKAEENVSEGRKRDDIKRIDDEMTGNNGNVNSGLLPYPKDIKPPEEFFREFIEPYGVKKEFMRIYYERIKRRKELPHPNELAADLADMKSGITNARAINYIAEEYSYALQDYLREVGENERMLRTSFGIKVGMPKPHNPGYIASINPYQQYPNNPLFGYPQQPVYPSYNNPGYPNYNNPGYPNYNNPGYPNNPVYPSYNNPGYPNYNNPGYPNYQPPIPPSDKSLYKEIEDLKRLIRERDTSAVRSKYNDYTHQLLSRIEKLEDELKERERERIERLEQELREATMNKGFSRDDAEQIVRRILEEYQQRVTPEDVRKILKEEIDRINMNLSKEDRDFLISKEKLNIEREKLREKSKTREAIAEAVRSGFSSIGQALSRTLLESGSNTEYAVQGYSNQNQSLWQVQCPGCGAIITAPIGSKVIQCPSCNRKYTVELPGSATPSTSPTSIDADTTNVDKDTSISNPSTITHSMEVEVPDIDVSKYIDTNIDVVMDKKPIIDKKERSVCPICGRKFTKDNYLNMHLERKHKIDLKKFNGDREKAIEDYIKKNKNIEEG